MELLDIRLLGNTLGSWLSAVGLAAGLMVALLLLRMFAVPRLARLAERTGNRLDDLIVQLIEKTNLWVLAVLCAYFGSKLLNLSNDLKKLLSGIAVVTLLCQFGLWINYLVAVWQQGYVARKMSEDAAAGTTLKALANVGRFVIWAVLLLLALHNVGVNVTGLIAGLGVGGIAVAMATQNILKDLFASFSIVLDKPFVIGDFIVVGDFMGTVEKIGIKTTRIRSLSGEQITFCNNDLVESRVRNYKRMGERRVVFNLGVVYQTPADKLEAIPGWIKEIIDANEMTRFDRAHFKGYGAFSLDFEVVYYVLSPDYTTYMDVQQAINLAVFRKFQEEKVEFAYPTQTLFVEK